MESNSVLKNKRKTVEEPTKEQGMWIFADIECQVDKKVSFTWNSLFQAFQDKEFQILLQDDVNTKLSKEVYMNIIKSGLHRVVVKILVLPCPDVIEWITQKIDHEDISILNSENKSVANYKASIFNQIYHLKETNIKVTLECLKQKNESADFLTIMKGLWFEGQFRAKSASAEWKTSKFGKSVQIIVILLSRVFERKDGSTFPDKWIPIIYQIITSGSTLNWGELISSNLDVQLRKSQKDHQFFHVLILNECDVCQFRISISWVEMGIHPSIDTCILQDSMGN
jgi:hypothetical protein